MSTKSKTRVTGKQRRADKKAAKDADPRILSCLSGMKERQDEEKVIMIDPEAKNIQKMTRAEAVKFSMEYIASGKKWDHTVVSKTDGMRKAWDTMGGAVECQTCKKNVISKFAYKRWWCDESCYLKSSLSERAIENDVAADVIIKCARCMKDVPRILAYKRKWCGRECKDNANK
jgi:predicted ribonuclease YlaK